MGNKQIKPNKIDQQQLVLKTIKYAPVIISITQILSLDEIRLDKSKQDRDVETEGNNRQTLCSDTTISKTWLPAKILESRAV